MNINARTGGKSSLDYQLFRDFLQKSCGIALASDRDYLIDSRMRAVLRDHQLESLHQLVCQLQKSPKSTLAQTVIEAMTTHETLWFRDRYPFEALKNEILPVLSGTDRIGGIPLNQPLRIWSAACSSGQEPYSISMSVEESRGENASVRDARIVATDISSQILAQAESATYEAMALRRGLNDAQISNFFNLVGETQWQVKPTIKQRVQFRTCNLQEDFSHLGRFDIIFCRNVLIYFSAELQRDILRRIANALLPGGYFFMGGSESTVGLDDFFKVERCGTGVVYRHKS